MASEINPPITGIWNCTGYPQVVHLGGRWFRKAELKQQYPGVVEQYREDVKKNSRHLKVMANGIWRIDHIDDDNPDRGRPIQHFINDHPLAGLVGVALLAVGGFFAARAITRG